MTTPLGGNGSGSGGDSPLGVGLRSRAASGASDPEGAARAEAAEQFESLLVQQLWQTMRSTVGGAGFGGGGAGSDTYMHFMDEAVARQLTEAGGIGVRSMLMASMGGPTSQSGSGSDNLDPNVMLTRRLAAQAYGPSPSRSAPMEIGPATGMRVPGATGRLQDAARELLQGESPQRFGRDGRLTTNELASDFRTESEAGAAHFNVHDAAGFEGEYKCNLFAFEMARRAGFQTPVQGRNRGWGYPAPDAVTADAATGRLRQDWGRVATGEAAEAVDGALQSGQRAFMLTSAGTDGHAGHMAVVERVHSIEYDDQGQVQQIVFDGWEARSRGARHLSQRTWNRVGNHGGNDPRGGLSRIELIELLAPREGRPEMVIGGRAGASVHDR